MSKRGRKPSTEKKGYFYENEQNAVLEYIQTTSKEKKDEIFETTLKTAFTIMIESIIRRYNLYPPDESFIETFDDTMSFLITKLDKFKTSKGRAYSYLQTICKNYLIYKINKYKKNQIRNTSYDEIVTQINEHDDKLNQSTTEDIITVDLYNELINDTVSNINEMISNNEAKQNKDNTKLNEDEIKVGICLIDLLTNWEYVFETVGCDKFNKNSILTYIKNETGLNTKDIRDSMRKFKMMYFVTKEELLA